MRNESHVSLFGYFLPYKGGGCRHCRPGFSSVSEGRSLANLLDSLQGLSIRVFHTSTSRLSHSANRPEGEYTCLSLIPVALRCVFS